MSRDDTTDVIPVWRSDRFIWECSAAVGTVALGSLFHFTYEWSGDSPGVAWFSATNESVWEHLKLLVMPATIFTFAMAVFQKYSKRRTSMADESVWMARTVGLLCGLAFVVAVFYTYTLGGQQDRAVVAVDITTFILAAVLIGVVSWFMRRKKDTRDWVSVGGAVLASVIFVLFVVFSYAPPTDKGLWFPYPEISPTVTNPDLAI